MHDILTIGSALVDIFLTSKHFEVHKGSEGAKLCQLYGEKLEVDSFEVRTGGGASNAAVGFARAGFSVATITETGRDVFAKMVVDELHAEYVRSTYVVQEKKEQTGGSVILVGKDGGRTVMVHRGASSLLDPEDISEKAIATAQWVHLSSISGRLATLQKILKVAMEHNVKLSWNPGRGELELLSSGKVSIADTSIQVFIVNASEWESLGTKQDDVIKHMPEIIITDGSKTGRVIQRNGTPEVIKFTPLPVAVVDETGAGDAFAVGYVTARLKNMEIKEALEWAQRNSQSVVQHFGAKEGLLKETRLSGKY